VTAWASFVQRAPGVLGTEGPMWRLARAGRWSLFHDTWRHDLLWTWSWRWVCARAGAGGLRECACGAWQVLDINWSL